MLNPLEQFYLKHPEPIKSCLDALRLIISNSDSEFSQCLKYGMPCFCLGSKPFCYLWVDKKKAWPYILVVKGNEIDHPFLEQGERSKMKRIMLDPNQDLPIETILEILGKVKSFYR